MKHSKELSYAIIEYLKTLASNESETKLVDNVSNMLGVDFMQDAKECKLNRGLAEIFEAGKTSLNATCGKGGRIVDPIENTDLFKQYLEKVVEKGFFKDVQVGSDEYNQRYDRLLAKYKEKFGSTTTEVNENNDELGDKYKNEGNAFISKREFEQAAAAYTKAIEVCPTGDNTYVYYCNRAAAYLHLKNYEAAYEDCLVTVGLSPDYAKGHARLAQAALHLGNKEEAESAAKDALELDPSNAVAKTIMAQLGKSSISSPSAPASAGGDPMADMMKNMDPNLLASLGGMGGGAGAGGGGMPDLGSLLNNPQMMAMAQQMMQDPNTMRMAQQMMQDPQAMENMMKMMGRK